MQVIYILFINISIILYQGSTKPLTYPIDNKVELFNEFMVSVCSMHLMFFTDAVEDLNLQY